MMLSKSYDVLLPGNLHVSTISIFREVLQSLHVEISEIVFDDHPSDKQ